MDNEDLVVSELIAKIKWNGIIYTKWEFEEIQGLWIEFGPLGSWVCVYQQTLDTKETAILKLALHNGYFASHLNEWIENNKKQWWEVKMSPEKVYKELELLSVSDDEKMNVNGSLNVLLKSFVDIYVDFIQDLSTINKIDYDTIEFGAAYEEKMVSACYIILYHFVYIILYHFVYKTEKNVWTM